MTHPPTFRRPLSPLDWWFISSPRGMSPTLGIVVEGEGTLDLARLTEAVAVASEACPGMRLVREGKEWVDGGKPALVTLLEVDADADPMKLPELVQCLVEADGALCQVDLVRRRGANRDAVAFRANHAVTDADGLLIWIRDVFRALRGEPVAGAPDAISDRDVYEQFPHHTESQPLRFEWPPIIGNCEPTVQPGVVAVRRVLQGRHVGISARIAALFADLVAGRDPSQREAAFYVPINLRHYRPDVRSTANLSLGMPIRVSAGENWTDVHARLLGAIKDGAPVKNVPPVRTLTAPLPVVASMLRQANRQTRTLQRFPANATISHAGRVDLADLCAPGFTARTAFILERPLPGEAPVFSMLEFDWHTEITVSWWDGASTAAALDTLLDRVAEGIETPASVSAGGQPPAGRRPVDVVTRFLQRVAETPDALALDGGADGRLTYRQMERRSAEVAAALIARGVGAETVVGVLGDRSLAATIAVWGVLRAGGGYLPIDARNPDGRVAGVLADAGASICLVQRPYEERDCVPDGCVSLVIDDLIGRPGDNPVLPAPEIRDGQLAYLIYTSGSTGRPKGVEISHGALRAWADWTISDLGLDARTRIPLLASVGFDVAACALYLPLLVGGTTVLRPAEINHTMLRELLLESGANTLLITPSHLALINSLGLRPAGFRKVVTMGEPLSPTVARQATEVFGPDCTVVNSYGPTETTVIMTSHVFDPDGDEADAALVPLGLAAFDTTVHVVDDQGRFVADGEIGELWIGGPQLARGYRGQPELTRRAFVHLADGTRVYRSGDLGRRRSDGRLEFVSRIDDQVKILGNRVEPAETAHVLRGHPEVADAVVLPRTSGDDKALAAYVVRVPGSEVTVEDLIAHAAAALPPYLVPAATVFVDALPHTLNGKVNASQLPNPFSRVPAPTASAATRDATATAVAGIWSEILGIEPDRLDEDASFQDLGGNSLKLLTMLAAVADQVVGEAHRVEFDADLGSIIRTPTLRRVADAARRRPV